ncbi:putative TonB-dependent outer membrane receptor precursor [Flavobacterium anhuiense]|uniref:Putative TonB-dependent outer membrane receptor n=1 Tax=Flavobacterium anhuiense TaxID=459526 RepID=A0A444W1T1_9FLAO|nr:outer membrane beta-barrel family protein [Flavobacterium anhuiense]RYJ39666.1 putative TonB-dependent outer membrane receptor precursor [Flavobacterium anhuiense]
MNQKLKKQNKIKRLIFLILILLPIALFSQIKITGKITESNSRPIELAEAIVLTKDSIAEKSSFSNEKGYFQIEVKSGSYILQIRQIGKSTYTRNLTVDKDIDMGDIQLIEEEKQLQQVVVTAKKKLIERKVDRLVFNVENSVAASGGDALDALKVAPGIRVQNETVSMIGKSGIGLMVDDRLIQLSGDDLVNYLKSISSDNIKSIEIITTPPAKYDAEGNSGLINIKLKRPKNDSWNVTLRNTMKQATYFSDIMGANFSFQKKKISFLADIGFNKSKTIYENDITYNYPSSFWNVYLHNVNNTAFITPTIIFNYKVTDKTTLGVQYIGTTNKPTIYDYSNSIVTNKETGDLENIYTSNGNSKIDYSRSSLNVNGVTKLNEKGKLMTFDLDYLTYKNNKINPFNSIILDQENNVILDNYVINKGNLEIKNYAGKIDFIIPSHFANYEYGGKLSFINTNSAVNLLFYDNIANEDVLNQETQFDYQENTQAIYFSANKKIKKWEFKVGLRFENTQTKGAVFSENITNRKNYSKFFPTLFTTFTVNENNSFSFSLNRRINRPGYDYVNPARRYSSINSYVFGNPFLQPSFVYNAEIKHSYKSIFTSSASYTIGKNNISQINIPQLDNTQTATWENYADYNRVNLDESINFDFNKRWSTVSSIYFYYVEYKSHIPEIEATGSGAGGGFETRHTFTANKAKTFFIEGAYWYDFQSMSMQVKKAPASSLDISFKYFYLDKKLQLTLLFTNILKSDRVTMSYTSNNIDQSFRQYYDTQSIRLSLLYKFGSNKIGVKQRKLGNQEEIQRVN